MEWMLAFHNGISGGGCGVHKIMVKQEDLATFNNVWTWPGASCAMDQGGDGMSACQAADSIDGPIVANLKREDDYSHGYHNDFDLSDRACDIWPQRSAMRLARNAHLGPFGTKQRFVELKQVFNEYVFTMSPESCPVFQSMLEDFLDDRGELHRATEDDIGKKVWESLKKARIFRFAGDEQAPSRFLSDHMKAREFAPVWTEYAFAWYLLALKQGRLDGSKLGSSFKNCKLAQGLFGDTVLDKSIKADAKAAANESRPISKNQAEFALLQFANIEFKFIDRLKVAIREPYCHEHGVSNATLRDVRKTIPWEIAMISGNFLDPMFASFAALSKYTVLGHCGLLVESNTPEAASLSLEHPLMEWNREQAKRAGRIACKTAFLRSKRMLPLLRGWPQHAVYALKDSKTNDVLGMFRRDHENYLGLAGHSKGLQDLVSLLGDRQQANENRQRYIYIYIVETYYVYVVWT